MIKRNRTLKQRAWMVYDDFAWWWGRNCDGLMIGFVFGIVLVIIAFEWVIGLSQ